MNIAGLKAPSDLQSASFPIQICAYRVIVSSIKARGLMPILDMCFFSHAPQDNYSFLQI